MPFDFRAVLRSKEAPLIAHAVAACAAVQMDVRVLRDWEDWSRFTICTEGPFRYGDLIMGWLSHLDFAAEIRAAVDGGNTPAITETLRLNRAGVTRLGEPVEGNTADTVICGFSEFAGDHLLANNIAWVCGHSFVAQRSGYVTLHGNYREPSTELLYEMSMLEKSCTSGSKEERIARAKAESNAKHEAIDAEMTDHCCPECGKPMPAYRNKCRFCGFVRGRL